MSSKEELIELKKRLNSLSETIDEILDFRDRDVSDAHACCIATLQIEGAKTALKRLKL